MSFFGNKVTLRDGPQLDAFSRLRVSQAITLFDSQQEYGLDTLRAWDATANGVLSIGTGSSNGSVSSAGNSVGPRDANTRMVPIVVSTTSGHYSVLQSRQYIRYVPGKSHLILMTGVFSPGVVANTDARIGYFDGNNGIFLKVTNGAASFVRRTSTSGVPDDTDAYVQANWNIDPFDGTGPSGITLDLTKTQILFIQAQWLGVGRVIVGFDIDGILYPAHQFLHANVLTVPYTQSFNLPVRLELRNTGTSAGGTISFVCCSVQSEGGEQLRGWPHSSPAGIATVAVTTRRPVLSIRNAATYNALTNRTSIADIDFLLRATTNDAMYEVVVGGTLTGASWTAVDTNSASEYDTTATAITGGISAVKGFVVSGSGASSNIIKSESDLRNPLVISQIDSLGLSQPSLSIVCTSFGGTSNITAVANWHEQVI